MGAATIARGADTPHHGFAAPTNTLSLEWVVGEVRSNNPSLKSSRALQRAMEQRAPQARDWEDPRGGVTFNAGRFVHVAPDSFTDQGIFAEQAIPVTGKNKLRENAAGAEAKISAEETRRHLINLTTRAQVSYFRLGNAYAQWEINRNSASLLKQIADTSRNRFESAKETEADVLSAETELAKLEENAFDLEQQISDEQTVLNTLMNHPPNEPLGRPVISDPGHPRFSFVTVEALALARRPEIIAAKRRIDAAKAKLKLSQRERIPEPNVRLEANRYNGDSLPVTELMGGISFNLPWFNHKKYAAAIEENKSLAESAERDLESLEAETRALVRDQLKKIETFHHHHELFRDKISPLAQQTIEASQTSYQSDRAGLMEVLIAQRNAQDSASMLAQHETDYQIALIELEAIVGAPLAEITLQEENK